MRRLPLTWKILTPSLVLVLVVGPLAGFLIARDRASRADAALSRELAGHVVDARARLHDRGLRLYESASQAANLQGMATAVERRDGDEVEQLLRSVLALKPDLALLRVLARDHTTVAALGPGAGAATEPVPDAPDLADLAGGATERLVAVHGRTLLTALPICAVADGCRVVGVALAGDDLDAIVRDLAAPDATALGVYGASGALTAAAGRMPPQAPGGVAGMVRHDRTMFAPLEVDGRRIGTIGVSAAPGAGASGGGTGLWLATILFAAMVAVVGLGLVIARSVLAQVRVLHTTSRQLGAGALATRAPVMTDDEIGDLARVLNQMADELQAGHELLEARVEERTEHVRRLLQQRTEFFMSLSHELRTPLAIILSQARLQRDPAFRGRRGDAAGAWAIVETSAEQLLDEVNAVLELARVSSGRVEAQFDDVELRRLLAPLHGSFEPVAASHGLDLRFDVPPDAPAVRADPALLREAIVNVVDNAVKYTPAGGHVDLTVASRNGSVEITVADSGIGIPAEDVERVFEPFYRVPGSRTQHGEASTGLGLAVTKRLVELQGGSISLAPSDSGGTAVTVSLHRTR